MSMQEELPPAVSRSIEQLERHYFVGRKHEIRLFRKRLKERSPKGRILNVHGTGGAGKSFLLAEYRRLAERADARFVLMDCRTMPRNPGEFCLCLHRLIQPNSRKTRRRLTDSPSFNVKMDFGSMYNKLHLMLVGKDDLTVRVYNSKKQQLTEDIHLAKDEVTEVDIDLQGSDGIMVYGFGGNVNQIIGPFIYILKDSYVSNDN
ncbi:ATP-binding protein [Paenibacillus sp. BC26]|uniref:ATP-binding protein n=1 Tax=Paenibacillus sp. BC26 TaxID=1881032 RepID=UPI0008E81122|nr:ATP-binding protein [Paenibacillus sp. BC26]SFS58110.1 AAA ATPase domain-containing protein [Paenibacillus sp. BC26]